MTEQFTNGYALLIGVSENHVERWALPDVVRDISALAKVLTHPERCAYPTNNVKVISDKEATRQGILEGLEWLQERIQADTSGNETAIVYYTGHGWRDNTAQPPEYYLIPYDVREDQIRLRALRALDFADAVGALNPRRLLVVLDCCHSGGMGIKDPVPLATDDVGSAVPAQLLMAEERSVSAADGAKGLEALRQGSGRAVLSSSQGQQPSYMRRDRKISIFTYHLIEALTGHAQPQEGATEVLVSDVMSYVWRHVPRSARGDWGVAQEPDYQVSGNFPVALLMGGKGLSRDQPAPDPLAMPISEGGAGVMSRTDTSGGAYVAGSVDAGRDFVGRDRVIHGDEVGRDQVTGDKIKVGRIGSMVGSVVGRGTVQAGIIIGRDQITRLFEDIYLRIKDRPEDPNVDREELKESVERIENEVAKGEEANPNKVSRWLQNLVAMAPDIFDVTVAALTNPIAGVATVIRKVALKAKEEA